MRILLAVTANPVKKIAVIGYFIHCSVFANVCGCPGASGMRPFQIYSHEVIISAPQTVPIAYIQMCMAL